MNFTLENQFVTKMSGNILDFFLPIKFICEQNFTQFKNAIFSINRADESRSILLPIIKILYIIMGNRTFGIEKGKCMQCAAVSGKKPLPDVDEICRLQEQRLF